jgi:pyrroloquinoline quinone biosynthesis protein E
MAENMGAEYVELANTQFYSWASLNKKQLMPTKKQCNHAEAVAMEFRERLGNKMKIYFVMPDYYSKRPKKCMNGWGNVFITVQADGTVLPCHVAGMLPNIEFSNVKEKTLEWIWYDSPSFNLFRGDDWMKEPCKSCPEKEKDLGGCRCQAYMLAGDASLTDPICEKSPHHAIVRNVVRDAELLDANEKPIIFRTDSESRRLMGEKVNGKLNLEDRRLFEEEATASAEKSRVGSV